MKEHAMKRSILAAVGVAAVVSLGLSACGGGGNDTSNAPSGTPTADTTPVTISLSGWSLATTPEFQTLADGFHAAHPNVTVELKEYDAANYDTQLTADLAAGSAPDVVTLKVLKTFLTYQGGKQLLDISDVAKGLSDKVSGADNYVVDGKTYAIPYRQDSWLLYYNKDLFDKAGVATPDGTWTWDDYADAAKELTTKLKAAGSPALGTYQHGWQSTVQGFADAQTHGVDLTKGDYTFLKPYYDRVLDLQKSGAQVDYGTVTTNKLTYQAEFGKQQAAMMPMGSWYVATLLAQQKSGDADTFNWGLAPAPQFDSSTTGTSKTPVTFGDPTGMAINAATAKDDKKLAAAKEFMAYIATPEAAKALAGIGIASSYLDDSVVEAYFAVPGAPTDDLSKFAFGTHETKPENPVSPYIAGIQDALNDAHSSIMSGSSSVDDAITAATKQIKDQVLTN